MSQLTLVFNDELEDIARHIQPLHRLYRLEIGRPKMVDRKQALLAPVNVFWTRGYEGAPMKNLTEAIGINAPSLHTGFGDKHELYLQAIDRYTNNDACALLVALEQIESKHAAARAFLKAAVDYSTDHDSGAKGCFLASCVSTSAGHVEGVPDLLHEAITATDPRTTAIDTCGIVGKYLYRLALDDLASHATTSVDICFHRSLISVVTYYQQSVNNDETTRTRCAMYSRDSLLYSAQVVRFN